MVWGDVLLTSWTGGRPIRPLLLMRAADSFNEPCKLQANRSVRICRWIRLQIKSTPQDLQCFKALDFSANRLGVMPLIYCFLMDVDVVALTQPNPMRGQKKPSTAINRPGTWKSVFTHTFSQTLRTNKTKTKRKMQKHGLRSGCFFVFVPRSFLWASSAVSGQRHLPQCN